MPGSVDGPVPAASSRGDRFRGRGGCPGCGHLPRHSRVGQPQAGISGYVMKWSLLLLFATVAFAGDGARLFYSRSFPGSTPAYLDVTVESNGDASYREAVDDELPTKFHLSDAEKTEVFAL